MNIKGLITPSSLLSSVQDEQIWVEKEFDAIGDETIQKMIAAAKAVRENAYPPYSKFYVGAAVLTVSGEIYASCNAERVSPSETDHAEQSTVTKAISEGAFKKNGRIFIRAVAVVGKDGVSPCGQCRQVMIEHADNALIIMADVDGTIKKIVSLRTLLPLAFTPKDLE